MALLWYRMQVRTARLWHKPPLTVLGVELGV